MLDTSSTAIKALVAAFMLTALAASRFNFSEVSPGISLHSLLETKPLLASNRKPHHEIVFL
jgi:hypothetical protein